MAVTRLGPDLRRASRTQAAGTSCRQPRGYRFWAVRWLSKRRRGNVAERLIVLRFLVFVPQWRGFVRVTL